MPYALDTYPSGMVLVGERQSVLRCPMCKVPTHRFEDGFDCDSKPSRDFSCSADGFEIVSQRVKEFFEERATGDVEFFPLVRGYWVVLPKRSVFLDLSEAELYVYNEQNNSIGPACGRMNGIFLKKPWNSRIMNSERMIEGHEVAREAQELGSQGAEMIGLLVGDEMMGLIKSAGFSGVEEYYHLEQPVPPNK